MQGAGGPPVLVLNTTTKRETGREAQQGNIMAAKTVAEVIRTCLGPRAMLKMILDPMGGICLTNDGNSILREIDVNHPAAKSMIELSRAQDESVGDGTTSVIVLAGEILHAAEPWLLKNLHPTVIISAFFKALDDAVEGLNKCAIKLDLNNRDSVMGVIRSCIGTKFVARWSPLMCQIALDAVNIVKVEVEGRREIDTKKYCRIEKIPGGDIEQSSIIPGVVLNKDVTHAKMRRRIVNPRVILLDCPLEFKKGESMTNVECLKPDDFALLLKVEEEYIEKMCAQILRHRPDLVITEKGLSDLAQHYFVKNNVTALRRLRKSDNNRLARVSGATIVHRPEEIKESDVGTQVGLFEVKKIGDEYFSFITECRNPKACTILLRGASKDVLNEVERNLLDALSVARCVVNDPRVVAGGGASEMAVSQYLSHKARSVEGCAQWPYQSVALAMEVIPRTLAQNCGADVVRVVTELRAKHATAPDRNFTWGIDGTKGTVVDMNELGIWEPFEVKSQTIKTAIEAACLLLRVDDILSGVSKKKDAGGSSGPAVPEEDAS
ncbi:CCT chaperonin gamma subunit [Pelomyxa schiedti]|nr:CCT chaperonin gamma subunit [Pelomyxa schiedti]